ncbi:MAG: hypothetical protein MUF49_05510 [Oculatellaceae cyanobacterium Prado106]|nr:hypothetical protein [Oculatellaceae cyanobacterium Prado106]
MTSTRSRSNLPFQYSPTTLQRAARAARCAPFQLPLYVTMRQRSVELKAIAGKSGFHNKYTRRVIAELRVENELLWLIQVGVLRREVDGQGLTDSFRLTPLGHQLVSRWQQETALPAASWGDRLYNALSRWVRLPGWI